MKIKMNNAVGPQVRAAKPKPSKLLPSLGVASMEVGIGLFNVEPRYLRSFPRRRQSMAKHRLLPDLSRQI